ncbi:glycosyltransferase family 9 protein [Pseudonocardia cypriaca]|uniref:ADP-heptose:LPS heptosyltransferase n=1 Tax=Pseudonocardia cypriaca TaxID=882449 RepID=A0A543GH32_9PSEU|nr:glycosyltransferase family 9 protein [Pseudonocardia cypriaca]TQM45388.1 ADP-heptose:LPS heptosyltransferase [Pseudonocardia cypriaca]
MTAAPPRPTPGRHPGADRGGPVDLAAARRLLVVRADNIGDVVTTTPALRALRAAAPHARIDLLASPAGSAVVPMVPELDGVLVTSASWQQLPGASGADQRAEQELLGRIAAGGYDVLIVLTSFSQSPWPVAHLGLLAGIGTRVVHSREFGGAVATHWVTPPPDGTHQVDRALHLLGAIGVPHRGLETALSVPADARRDAATLVPRRPFAVLAPGASCAARRYPAERFGAAAALLADAGLPVLVAGSEREGPLVAEVVAAAAHPDVTPVPPVPLPVFTALIARAAVAVTNNSGGMHLADAVRTPVAVTYGGTERLEELCPRSTPATLLSRPVPCSPCRQLQCPFQHECLDIPPGEVAAAALALAGSHPERGTPDISEEIPCVLPAKP